MNSDSQPDPAHLAFLLNEGLDKPGQPPIGTPFREWAEFHIRQFQAACYRHAAAVAFTEGVEYPIASVGHTSASDAAEWHMLYTRKEIARELNRLASETKGE